MARVIHRIIRRAAPLPLFLALLLLAGCDSVDTLGPEGASPAIDAAAGAAPARAAVCHLTDTGDYIKITVSSRAYAAHVRHGDGGIGEAVPGMPGFTFDEDCNPFSDEPIEPVLLWDNGSIVTHPGGGFGGADLSMADMVPNIAGSNVRLEPGQTQWRIADDFIVPAGGWHLGSIITYAYEIGAPVPGWTGFNATIWNGRPGDLGSEIVATTTAATFAFAGVYRVFSNGDRLNPDRPVQSVTWDLGGTFLPEGSYWFSWQVEGGSTAWTPHVMEANPAEPNDTATVYGNGRHLEPTGWTDLLASPGAETFLQVYGSPLGPVAGIAPPAPQSGITPQMIASPQSQGRGDPTQANDSFRN
jgi:hypothetical protein